MATDDGDTGGGDDDDDDSMALELLVIRTTGYPWKSGKIKDEKRKTNDFFMIYLNFVQKPSQNVPTIQLIILD